MAVRHAPVILLATKNTPRLVSPRELLAMQSGIEEHNAAAASDSQSMEKHGDVEQSQAQETLQCPPHTSERRLMAKIDFHVVPFLCIMYLLAFLGMIPPLASPMPNTDRLGNQDRVNIANANVFGLSEELGLTGTMYNNALVIFFVPYIIFEVSRQYLRLYHLARESPIVAILLEPHGFLP